MQREILSKRKPRKISFRYKGGAEKARGEEKRERLGDKASGRK